MKAVLVILIIFTLISCKEKNDKESPQNDRLELVPEPDQDLREEYEQQLELNSETTFQEYLGEELIPIREIILPLSNREEWTTTDKRKLEAKNQNGVANYYFLKNDLKKIQLTQNTDSTARLIEYYLHNDSLIFAFEQQDDSTELKNNPEYYEPIEDSLFFKKGELIRIKNNMDCGSPFADDYRNEVQEELKTEFRVLFNRLKE